MLSLTLICHFCVGGMKVTKLVCGVEKINPVSCLISCLAILLLPEVIKFMLMDHFVASAEEVSTPMLPCVVEQSA